MANSHHPKPEPGVVINPPASRLGTRNAILWGQARRYHVADFRGPLSIKTVVHGSALWGTSEAERRVEGGHYLILNAARSYSLTIDSPGTVETFCLFFRNGFVEDACRVESTDSVLLLDDPTSGSERSNARAPAEFFETLHPPDSIVSPLLERMYWRVAHNTASDAWLEDQFVAAAAALSRVHGETHQRASKIPAKKPSTRVELYRRLLRGKDYMDSFFGDPLRLAEVANQACLSPYHFHRLFREVFRETPNQYLQRRRLASAQRLLERSEQSVTGICLEVGFESISSFSALFRRTFGCPPREYRFRKNRTR